MTETNVIDTVLRLKQRAQTARKRQKYDEAHKYLGEALTRLETEYENVSDPKYRADISVQLADCYGIMGGILRREGHHREALESYEKGYKYEESGNTDTYNLSNTISLRIILDGSSISSPAMKRKLNDAIEKITQQIVSGKRAGEWWAWADRGMFNLLAGNCDAAIEAYSNMRGAKDDPYTSHIAVLTEILDSLRKVDSAEAKKIAVDVENAIKVLNDEKAKWTPPAALF